MISIRTQDKMALVPYNMILSIWNEKNIMIGNSKEFDNLIKLGTYATKERALEVLDEIEEMACDVYRDKINVFDEEITKGKNGIRNNIYQMPKE